ncbi:MAG: hypothetical protein DRQ60_05750 [Gammaproteobacteria bacterium]|nr:MAG: hypothetical protein DRQ54_04120 [Gammaproteobacteria bacterium]RLA13069.1 MAG: hypothetical protein DRQ52_06915 [Gammaproteobacteria bacterium]RLA15529.1 MAG: hypothetical protein DRQ60_05750 [Gammaproteobacteria bacterium]
MMKQCDIDAHSIIGSSLKQWLQRLFCAAIATVMTFPAWAQSNGVALQYHRISDSGPAITRISPADFTAHLELIERLGFPVLPLDLLLTTMCDRSGSSASAVALTFDDAHRTVFEQAWPLLRERGWPFVVFVNTAAIDQRHGGSMSWDQLRELAQAGVIIGNHSVDHQHMSRKPAELTAQQWALWRRQQVVDAQQRIDAEVGTQPKIFAYPYGEYDLATAEMMADLGYTAFGHQSGAFGCSSHLQALPRFQVSGAYADPESLVLKLGTLPFPIDGPLIEPVQSAGNRQPRLTLTFGGGFDDGFDPAAVNCFATEQGAIDTTWDAEQQVLVAQAGQSLPVGRSRYNCTARNTLQQRYHWFSQPWFIPDEFGEWPAE